MYQPDYILAHIDGMDEPNFGVCSFRVGYHLLSANQTNWVI
jgi:hypothetical protein